MLEHGGNYMKILVFAFGILFLSLSSLRALAAGPNDTVWQVTQKNCAGQAIAPSGNERLEFKKASLAHYFLATATETQYCVQIQSYVRNVKSQSEVSGVYTEASILIGTTLRQICYNKSDGSPVSDETKSAHGPMMSTSFTLTGEFGHVEMIGDKSCMSGALRYDLHVSH